MQLSLNPLIPNILFSGFFFCLKRLIANHKRGLVSIVRESNQFLEDHKSDYLVKTGQQG